MSSADIAPAQVTHVRPLYKLAGLPERLVFYVLKRLIPPSCRIRMSIATSPFGSLRRRRVNAELALQSPPMQTPCNRGDGRGGRREKPRQRAASLSLSQGPGGSFSFTCFRASSGDRLFTIFMSSLLVMNQLRLFDKSSRQLCSQR